MISSISIKNFQSHEDNSLEFLPGVNVIVGSSDSGKTAILRALNWVIYNRPSGLSYISYWNRDKKKQPVDFTSVSINIGDWLIHRIRSSEFNGYEIDNDESNDAGAPFQSLEAIGTDVPEEISKTFNLTEVNIQRQMDAPFLLSESSSEVARFFNRTIRLDLIDRVLSNAETMRRRIAKDIIETNTLIDDLEEEMSRYSWIEDACLEIQKAEKRKDRIENNSNKISELEDLVNAGEEYKEKINKLSYVEKASGEINKIIAKKKDYDDLKSKINGLESFLSDYSKTLSVITKTDKIIGTEKKVDDAISLWDLISEKDDTILDLEELNQNYNNYTKKILSLDREIESLKSQLPTICPYCGNQIRSN
jgi:DNA repair exonuclease SbcCD ATPase subunit